MISGRTIWGRAPASKLSDSSGRGSIATINGRGSIETSEWSWLTELSSSDWLVLISSASDQAMAWDSEAGSSVPRSDCSIGVGEPCGDWMVSIFAVSSEVVGDSGWETDSVLGRLIWMVAGFVSVSDEPVSIGLASLE